MYLYWVDTVPPVVYLYSVHHKMSLYGSIMIHVYIATMTLILICMYLEDNFLPKLCLCSSVGNYLPQSVLIRLDLCR